VKETRFRESKLCNVHAEQAHWKLWAFTLPLWAYVLVGFCPVGFCPMGFCPMGFCPDTVMWYTTKGMDDRRLHEYKYCTFQLPRVSRS